MSGAGDCRHFNGLRGPGMVLRPCRAGVHYVDVRDTSGDGPYRWPCLKMHRDRGCATSCAAFEAVTKLEAVEHEREISQAIDDALSGLCPQCGRVCELRKGKSADILVCPAHGGVMRACRIEDGTHYSIGGAP